MNAAKSWLYRTIDRDTCSEKLLVFRINTETDLLHVQALPCFRLVLSLGAVSGLVWAEKAKE